MITKDALNKIRVLAFDLDGTLLDPSSRLSKKTAEVLKQATLMGYHVVAATGRVLSTVPDFITDFPGIRYAVTSNGARVVDLWTGETLFESYLDPEAVRRSLPWLQDPEVMTEIFFNGTVYADARCFSELPRYGITSPRRMEYHRTTRIPSQDPFGLLLEHVEHIENINLLLADDEKRLRYMEEIRSLGNVTVVSSMEYNIELGGPATSKANALGELGKLLGFGLENIMCFGDGINDAAMVSAAGVGVAMGNGAQELKDVADWVTLTNGEDGVAFALSSLLQIPAKA